MKSKRYCAVLALLILLDGCHTASTTPSPNGTANMNAVGTQPVPTATTMTDELGDPNSPLAKRSVYFDFDSYTVKSTALPLLRAHADYLRRHPMQHILIQGNTDERGTDEYNLALGQRRSEAVLRELESLGVADSQMEAVSLGKEKPLATGHDEASWAQNRRVDLVYRR